MTATELLNRLVSKHVELWADGAELVYDGPDEALDPETVELLRQYKWELLSLLAPKHAAPSPSRQRCLQHVNPSDFVDEPPVDGRIRTHCRLCGAFIGFRPANRASTAEQRP